MSVAQIAVDLVARTDQFRREMDGAAQKMQQVGRDMQRVGGQLTTRVTLPLLAIGGAAVKMAVDAEESGNKFRVVMGDAADDVRDRFRDLQDTIPLTLNQMESLAAGVQDFLIPLGFARDEAAGMSADMVELAADLASFNNVAAEVPLQAIQSALAGMSRPLRQFGVDVSQTRLEMLALEEGIISAGEQMDSAARAQAVMIAVQRDSADAMGDAARTADSAANTFRFLRRDVAELGEEIGRILIPAAREMAARLREVVGWLRDMDEETQRTIVAVAGVAAAVGPLLLGLGTLIRLVASSWQGIRMLVLVLSRLHPAIAIVSTVVIAAIAAWRRWGDDVQDVVRAVSTVVRDRMDEVILTMRLALAAVRETWALFRSAVLDPVVDTMQAVRRVLIDQLGTIVGGAARILGRFYLAINPGLARALEGVQSFVADVQAEFDAIRTERALEEFDALQDAFFDFGGRVSDSAGGATDTINETTDAVVTLQEAISELADESGVLSEALDLDVEWAGVLEDALDLRAEINAMLEDGVDTLGQAVELTRTRDRLERSINATLQARVGIERGSLAVVEGVVDQISLMEVSTERVEVGAHGVTERFIEIGEQSSWAAEVFEDHWLTAINVVAANLGGLASQIANIATAFATGGIGAGIAAGATVLFNELFGDGVDRFREAAREWESALDDFVDMFADQSRWDRMRERVEEGAAALIEQAIMAAFADADGFSRIFAEELIPQIMAAIKGMDLDDALAAVTKLLQAFGLSTEEIEALTQALWDNLEAIAAMEAEARQQSIEDWEQELELRRLRALGMDEEADALELQIQRAKEWAEVLALHDPSLLAFLQEVWAVEDAAREAAEALAQMRFDRTNELSLWERQAALAGDDMAALSFRLQRQAQEEIWALEDLVEAGKMSAATLREWTEVIEGEVEQALRNAAQAAREAAEAERFRYRQTQQSLELRILEAQGHDEAVRALRNRMEVERFIQDGADAATLALLEQAQAAEAMADAQREATKAAEETTRSISGMARVMNAPTGLPLALRSFQAATMGAMAGGGGGQTTTTVYNDWTIQFAPLPGDSGETILRKIEQAISERQRRGGRNPMTTAVNG